MKGRNMEREKTPDEIAKAERHNALRRARRAANPEKLAVERARQRERDIAAPGRMEARRKKNAEYMRANYEKLRPEQREYNLANSAKIVAAVRQWRARNPEAVARHDNNRRARKLLTGGVLTRGLRDRLFVLQRGKCACCGEDLGAGFCLDHIIPLAREGENCDSNIQLLRRSCNAQKGAKDPVVFMRERGKLI